MKVNFFVNPDIPALQEFGTLQGFQLHVWGPNLPERTISSVLANPREYNFYGLNIYTWYNAYVVYVGSGYSVRSGTKLIRTGEYCKFIHVRVIVVFHLIFFSGDYY
jgi:hypothetical protein